MRIVWDEIKRQANLRKHGFDFAALDMGFFERALIFPAKQGRRQAIGLFVEQMAVVIFFRLGEEGLSIISMRAANRKERALYHDAKNDQA
ncbi:BrnT family toxin [Rhizobium sp. G21]|uniref:BrnT family toxin n=1 Tax=Rhizobium sp. G21 TaxID=2758439 RepID=UPI001603E87D|nr:BrnT family toxin [Rhizobium sp. G21]MBB1250242.1 BrnT family toxin [Rhizobium sp. G21]